jgi:hypothetical protein
VADQAQTDREAEAAYKSVENKLLEAKSIRVKFRLQKQNPVERSFVGQLVVIKDANKVFFELTDSKGELPEKKFISDGHQVKFRGFDAPDWTEWHSEEPPKLLDREVVYSFVRMGLQAGLIWPGASRRGWDVHNTVKLSDFHAGTKEKLGDRQTQSIRFSFTYKVTNKPWPASTLWIDESQTLPVMLKRVISGELTDDVTEIYDTIELNQHIDDKVFELPR